MSLPDDYPELLLQDFNVRFPEFVRGGAGPMMLACIKEALTEVSHTTFREKHGMAVLYLAAHKLAISPFGRSQRLVAKDGTSTYLTEFKRILREVTPQWLVT
jgi:hypothetical protein